MDFSHIFFGVTQNLATILITVYRFSIFVNFGQGGLHNHIVANGHKTCVLNKLLMLRDLDDCGHF